MSTKDADRLSSLDRAFLTIESGPLHMHVGAVAIFDGKALVGPDGALDVTSIRASIASAIASLPRFKQHVHTIPLLGAVWTEDPHYRLDFHVRHTAIPRPGTDAQLRALAGRLFSQRLDRERPLWELWLVEGLSGGRFAVITKAHHAMLDGVAGMGLLASLFSLEPSDGPSKDSTDSPPSAGSPEPGPVEATGRFELARSLFRRRVDELPKVRARVRELLSVDGRGRARHAIAGAIDLLRSGTRSAGVTPLNPDAIGPHRAFDGVRLPLDGLKGVRRALGGTLNDVVLAMVTGAIRRHLVRRGVDLGTVGDLRALVPVSLRPKDAMASHGNRVAMLIAHLPIAEPDPRKRLETIRAHTVELKSGSHEVEAAELVEELADLGPDGLIGLIFQAALQFLAFHVVVTNVPGPPFPLYLGPAKLLELYPLVPLFARQSFGIALASYDGGLFIGVNADLDAVPDLADLMGDIVAAEAELVALVENA